MLQTAKENFDKLENRILSINSNLENVNSLRKMLCELEVSGPTLIMATGGSKVVAYYLQLILERIGWDGVVAEVIEPREYAYKRNKKCYDSLVVISSSGETNGVKEALEDFKGNKYLVCNDKQNGNYNVVSWGNESYDKEHSFIALAPTLGPIAMMLDTNEFGCLHYEIGNDRLNVVNNRISELLCKSKDKVLSLSHSFKEDSTIHVLTGSDTRSASYALESTLVESGICVPVLHDKGSFCHGRSNIINDNDPIIYLSHDTYDFDKFLLDTLSSEYQNVFHLDSTEMCKNDIFWGEYYLLLQIYYLSKKIAEDKGKDLTKPKYKKKVIDKLYKYRGTLV